MKVEIQTNYLPTLKDATTSLGLTFLKKKKKKVAVTIS